MSSRLKIAFLTSIITAATVYVVLEWRPLRPTSRIVVERATITPETALAAPAETVQATSVSAPPASRSDQLSQDEQNNVEIYRRYSRGVVNITSTSFTYDFFLRPIPESGSGSGVVMDNVGHIVTNFHVIENARRLEVTLWDQSRHPAQVVGVDPNNDLAVIQVDAPEAEWVPIPFGTTNQLQVGQKVLAIGNPFGLERTLTTGIISSLARSIQIANGRVIEGIIQIDAAINSGNSGGPLLNTRGELIGINTAIVSGASGIGFAVPVETVNRVTSDLITYGRVRRVYIGFQGENLSTLGPLAEALDLGTESGVLIFAISPDSPAARGGVRGATRRINVGNYLIPVGGDVIVGIDGRTITTLNDIRTVLEPYQPGDTVQLTVVRDQQPVDIDLTLEEDPSS